MSDMVTLVLAHPLTAKQAERLHAKEAKDYPANGKIIVPRDDARSIINAGYAAGVEPSDHDAVRDAMDNGTAAPAAKATTTTKAAS